MSVQTKSPKRTKKATTSGGTRRAGRGAGKQTAGKSGHQKHVADLYEFTVNFFTILGAAVKRTDRRKHGPIVVTLSAELAAYFDTESLLLAFHQAEPVQGQLLVAHGSPIFDRMVTYLERKSAVTVQRLPIRYGAGEELLQAVRPTNAGIVNLRTRQEVQHLFAFHWRITYRADDKREEIYTVLLNDTGERISSYSEATTSSADPVRQFEIDTLLTDSEPIPPETDEEGQLVPPKLPPMTQLTRLAETARKYAVYHADVRCVSHESDILPRLYKTLNRLRTYYQQQIEEVYDAHDPTGEKRQALELDLERKLAEEVENHRLRVQLQLVNYAIFQMPVAEAHLTLSDGVREAAVVVERNRYTGALRRPTCHACGHEAAAVAIDRNGHITCDNCIQQCGTCQDILCADCGVASCPACGKLNCDTCGQLCWACGERACAEHISTCPTCGDAVCHSCQTACGACGVQQCRSHLRVDHVHSQRGETVLVCSNCAIRCPGCEQYSAQIGSCEQSGQRFCQECLATCTSCGRRVGPGLYASFGDEPYCLNCLQECPSCHSWALTTVACPTCGTGYCTACELRCALCELGHCPDHSYSFATCDHTVCQDHVSHCSVCTTELCPLCNDSCAICEGYHCAEHVTRCRRCSQLYCQSCVGEDGFCTSCAMLALDSEGATIDLAKEVCAADPRVAPLVALYSWTQIANRRYKIYWGQNALGQTALVVTQYDQQKEQVVAIRGKAVASAQKKADNQANSVASTNVEEKDPTEWMNEFQDWLRRMRRRRGR